MNEGTVRKIVMSSVDAIYLLGIGAIFFTVEEEGKPPKKVSEMDFTITADSIS